MGVVLDTTVLIDFERRRENISGGLQRLSSGIRGEDFAISAITVAELMRGVARARDVSQRQQRSDFVDELCYALPVISVDLPVALRAGLLSGVLEQRGVGLPFADLMIAATALEQGYRVATSNRRHFERVPDLLVIEL